MASPNFELSNEISHPESIGGSERIVHAHGRPTVDTLSNPEGNADELRSILGRVKSLLMMLAPPKDNSPVDYPLAVLPLEARVYGRTVFLPAGIDPLHGRANFP